MDNNLLELNDFGKRGFDIIKNQFFIEKIEDDIENNLVNNCENSKYIYFNSFDEYYNSLSGNIYENSCYYQYQFSDELISKYNLKLDKLNNTHFIDYQLEDFDIDDFVKKELADIELNDKKTINKKLPYKLLNEFENAKTYSKIEKLYDEYFLNLSADIYQVLEWYCLRQPQKAFPFIMKLFNNRGGGWLLDVLWKCFEIEDIEKAYEPNFSGSKQTVYKNKKRFKEEIELMKKYKQLIAENNYTLDVSKRYDEIFKGYYVNKKYCFENNQMYLRNYYFDNFNDFATFLNNDLSDCNLSNCNIDIDLEKYITNEKTVLPRRFELPKIKKFYINNTCDNNSFTVIQNFTDELGHEITCEIYTFDFFFDFVYFLDNDLSNTDFIDCDGLINLKNISTYKLENCKFQTIFMDKFKIKYEIYKLPNENDISFDSTKENEKSTELILQNKNEIMLENTEHHYNTFKIGYISDIHLTHKILNGKCKTEDEIKKLIKDYADNLKHENSWLNYTLVAGDVSSDIEFYKQFINNFKNKDTIYTLGNHELWSFSGKSVEEIIETYRSLIKSSGNYFLHNSIIYYDIHCNFKEISEKRLSEESIEELQKELRPAQLIIFGGLGFSKYNEKFNADIGLYRNVITRQQEIEEAEKFEELYDKVCAVAKDKNVIILTHNPKEDWSNKEYQKGFIYVSGHTHHNKFYDDGITRIYADNQIGYNNKTPHIKYFYISNIYDYFSDYEDGIYKITREEYIDFCRAKNMYIDFNRKGEIYMLKKDNYYCFLYKSKTGYSILNGGSLKKLENPDINYYYENIPNEIALIKEPLNKYSELQENISEEIKKMGGSGYIHGAIIDIDFYNHVYVNPYDSTITGYHALDIVNKYVFKNVPSLLCAECPDLFENYQKLISSNSKNELIIGGNTKLSLKPKYYPSTDIYKASREILKMQKTNKNILTTWYELKNVSNNLELPQKENIIEEKVMEAQKDNIKEIIVENNQSILISEESTNDSSLDKDSNKIDETKKKNSGILNKIFSLFKN